MGWTPESERRQIWMAALGAVDPLNISPEFFPQRPTGRLVVVGAGKAAARMGVVAEAHYGLPLEGLIVTPYGYDQSAKHLKVIAAGHPIPDEVGCAAAREILALAQSLGQDDLLLALLSGGASALLALPVEGVSLADKQGINRALLASGAPISATNTVRKHLSRIKGGRLAAAAWPARTVTLAISDVPGDGASTIASGPTFADPSTLADARRVLERYGVTVSPDVARALRDARNESVKAWDRRLWWSRYRLVARPADALRAAESTARMLGYRVQNLGDRVEGEASAVAAKHAHLAGRALSRRGNTAILSGGELTVSGASEEFSGGRCREYALALATAVGERGDVAALAGDTDGIDGTRDAAGAFVLPGDVARSRAAGREPLEFLRAHRSGDYFAALGRQLITGPTGTNVGDFRVILVSPRSAYD
jgi:hydroxypyruvate reductase